MTYYVIDPSGAQYGPADLALLQQWQREGRIMPSTTIRDASTGLTLPASSIPGLIAPSAGAAPYASPTPPSPYGASPQSPYGSSPANYGGYPQPGAGFQSRNDVTLAWILAITGLIMGPCLCPFLGIGLGVGGWYFAKRASQYGDAPAQGPLIASYAAIALGALMLVLGAMLRTMIGF